MLIISKVLNDLEPFESQPNARRISGIIDPLFTLPYQPMKLMYANSPTLVKTIQVAGATFHPPEIFLRFNLTGIEVHDEENIRRNCSIIEYKFLALFVPFRNDNLHLTHRGWEFAKDHGEDFYTFTLIVSGIHVKP